MGKTVNFKQYIITIVAIVVSFCVVFALSFGLSFGLHKKIIEGKSDRFKNTVYGMTLDLPVISIDTENSVSVTSKEEYLGCEISLSNTDTQYAFEGVTANIRGRGNTSWYNMPKKSYKIKFDKKNNLFGNGEAKKWTLIANYADMSLIRNYLAYSIGSQFDGIGETTTSTQFIELFINGEYQGVYLVCEQVEAGKNRVNISEDYVENGSPLLDTGYLLEMDFRAPDEGDEGYDYFALDDLDFGDKVFGLCGAFSKSERENENLKYYTVKSPDVEDIADDGLKPEEFISFIKSYLTECMQAITGGDYSKVSELIDVNSFADSYILNELFNNADVGQTSFYLYKKQGGKLYSGPLWDYDLSCGNDSLNGNSSSADALYAKEQNVWYYYLLEFEEFRSLVSEKLAAYKDVITETITGCIDYVYGCSDSFERNFILWDILGTKIWPNPKEIYKIDSWKGQVEYVRDWLSDSLEYITSVYCS